MMKTEARTVEERIRAWGGGHQDRGRVSKNPVWFSIAALLQTNAHSSLGWGLIRKDINPVQRARTWFGQRARGEGTGKCFQLCQLV